jgi:hypothetical protein
VPDLECTWCHNVDRPFDERIRGCENCHGPDSLHNIQADSPNANNIGTLVVGGEDAGYGHVGRDAGPGDSDCWGCHGFARVAIAAVGGPGTSALGPTIYNAEPSTVTAGTATVVTLLGSAFTNTADGNQYKSLAVLTAADGSRVTLTPDLIDEGKLAVTVPGDIAPGNYALRAVKTDLTGEPVASNAVVISIVPRLVVRDATWDGTTVKIGGSGFSGYAAGSGTSVTGAATPGGSENKALSTTPEATIVSWSDTAIEAAFDSRPNRITVNSVFSSATAKVSKLKLNNGHGNGGDK